MGALVSEERTGSYGSSRRMRARGLKTYSHLAEARQRPSEYEVATTRLHHHVERGLAIETPVAAWYTRHQRGSRWRSANWGRFADPRETPPPGNQPPTCRGPLRGNFSFFFERGRPSQPFP